MCSGSAPDPPPRRPPPIEEPPEIVLSEAADQKRRKRKNLRANKLGRSSLRIDLAIGAAPGQGLAIPVG